MDLSLANVRLFDVSLVFLRGESCLVVSCFRAVSDFEDFNLRVVRIVHFSGV